MSSVVIAGNTSGSVTLDAPAVAGTTVLTLPTTNGTLVTTGTTTGISGSAITTGTVGVSVGGTGANTLTANNVILGNGTSAVTFVAPGTNGNLLTSNGTTWTSAAAPAGGVTSLNGATGAIVDNTLNSIGSYAGVFTTNSGTLSQPQLNTTHAASGIFTYTPSGVTRAYTYFGLSGTWRIVGVSDRAGDASASDAGRMALAIRIS